MNKFILLITLIGMVGTTLAQESNSKIDKLTSNGDKTKWNHLNYILFNTNRESNNFKTRSFLIDKLSGKVRFEGTLQNLDNLVLLFNYKSRVIDKSYINGKLIDKSANVIPFGDLLDQFFEDTKLIFLPMLICDSHKTNLTINSEKIVNSEKLIEIKFKNIPNLNKEPLDGAIYLNNKGEIKEYLLDNDEIIVSDIKDIGDGIRLPTQFSFKNSPNLSIKFSTVAAFTNIEQEKFIAL